MKSNIIITTIYLVFSVLFFILTPSFAACPVSQEKTEDVIEELFQLSLEELMQVEISTVSKAPENLYDAPGIATIISREEIRRFGGNNLYDILDRAVSVYMTGSILYPRNSAAIRGDQITGALDRHVLLLLNGRPMRDALNGGINLSLYNAFPVSIIERIEITRGPGSALYGTNAYSGVINIITRTPPPTDCHEAELTLYTGSFGELGGSGYAALAGEDYHLSVGLMAMENDGWRFEGQDLDNNFGGMDLSSQNNGLVLEGMYQDWRFNLAWLNNSQDYQGVEMRWGIPNNTQSTRGFANIGYTWKFSAQQHLEANLTYFLVSAKSGNPHELSTKGRNDHTLLELTHYWQRGGLSWLMGGSAEYAHDYYIKFNTPFGEILNAQPPYDEKIYTLYTQLDYQLSANTQLTVGMQGVKNPNLNWEFIPRFGVIQQFGNGFGGKLLYSEAYRAATQVERNINLPIIQGNSALEPETVHTFDAQLFYHHQRHQASLTYFYNRQQALIDRLSLVPGEVKQAFFNKGELTLQGIELEGKTMPTNQWYLTGSLSYQKNENDVGIKDYTLVPNWLFKLGVSYQFPESGLVLGLFDTYVSQAPDANVRNSKRVLVNPVPQAYHLVTFNLEYPLGKLAGLGEKHNLVLNAYVYNLLDEAIYAPEINSFHVNSVLTKSERASYIGIKLKF